jgi:hypothetical protein
MRIDANCLVRTDTGASATITFYEGSIMDLDGSTEVELKELGTGDTTDVRLRQELGRTLSRVKKFVDPSCRYEIETVSAVAGVRGTTMFVGVAADGTTVVGNAEGAVTVVAQGVEVEVPAGTHSVVSPGRAPGLPQGGVEQPEISTPILDDAAGDLFDSIGAAVAGEGYLDIARTQAYFLNGTYTVRIELRAPVPGQTDASVHEIEWDLLVDADGNAATGTKWPLIGNDVGYDYLVRIWLMGATMKQGVLNTTTGAVTGVNYTVNGNIIEMHFAPDAIGGTDSFNWIVAVRKYMTGDPDNKPSVSDKAPGSSHYSLP